MPHEQRRRIKTRVYSVCVRVSILAQQANCSKACDKAKISQWYNRRSESRWPRDNQGATRQGRSTEKVCPSKALTPVAHFLQPGSTFFIFFSFFLLLAFFFQDFCLCVAVFSSACYMCGYLQRPEDVRTPGTGITSSCETPDISAGNQTWVPWESCECL